MKSRYRKTILILGFMVAVFATIIKGVAGERDWLSVVYGDWGFKIINWSPKRKLVATAVIGKNTPIWVPGGWGWYEAGSLKKVMDLGDGKKLMDGVIFYNFGLLPDKFIYSKEELGFEGVLAKWSVGRWWWWKWDGSGWIVKEDILPDSGEEMDNIWDKQVITGWAPVDRIGEEWRVYNASNEKGIGSFLAQRLVWGGMWVSNVANSTQEGEDKCQIIYRVENNKGVVLDQVKKFNKLWQCKLVESKNIKNGIELIIGPGMANLLKYNSYVRAF